MSRMLKALEQIERRRASSAMDEAIEALQAQCAEAAIEFSAAPSLMDIASSTVEAIAETTIEPEQLLSSDCFDEITDEAALEPVVESLGENIAEPQPAVADVVEVVTEHVSAATAIEPQIKCQRESTSEEVEPDASCSIKIGRFDLEADSTPLAEVESLPWHPSPAIEEDSQQQGDSPCDEALAEPERVVYELSADPDRTAAYRGLAQQIIQRAGSRGPHVVLFATPGRLPRWEFSIVDLAAAIARQQSGETIVIDARLERPWLSMLATAQGQPGLTDLLHGADWNDVPRETTIDRVDLLPVGRRSWSEPDAGASDADFGGTLALRYRFVLIDAGPADSAACQYLARACDDVYLVLGLKDTQRAAAQEALAALNAAGAPLAGCVAVNPA